MRLNPLTFVDGATPPASHTFAPVNPQLGSSPAVWLDTTQAIPILKNKITASVSRNTNGVYKVRVSVRTPIPRVTTPGCCPTTDNPLGYSVLYNIEASIPEVADLGARVNALVYVRQLLNDALSDSLFTNLESVY